MAANELGVKTSGDDFLLDFTQLGTGVFYTPWVENRRKTRTSQVLTAHPRTYCMPIEDAIIPGGTKGTVDDFPWIGLRFWRSEKQCDMFLFFFSILYLTIVFSVLVFNMV